jgi:hypothetical protein
LARTVPRESPLPGQTEPACRPTPIHVISGPPTTCPRRLTRRAHHLRQRAPLYFFYTTYVYHLICFIEYNSNMNNKNWNYETSLHARHYHYSTLIHVIMVTWSSRQPLTTRPRVLVVSHAELIVYDSEYACQSVDYTTIYMHQFF